MLFLPPNLKTYITIVQSIYWFRYYRIFLIVKDQDGNVIGKYEFTRIPYTNVGYVEFTTPSREGIYLLEYWLYERDGTPFTTIRQVILVVSKNSSLLGLLHQLYDVIEKHVFRRLDILCDSFKVTQNYVENVLLVDSIDVWATNRDCEKLLDEFIIPVTDKTKTLVEETKSKIEKSLIPNLNNIKNILQILLYWIKKRNA